MIKPGALVMAVLMAGVAAGTYYGLDFLPQGALPKPFGRTPPPPPPQVGASEGIVVAAVPLESAQAATPAPAPAQDSASEDLTEEPPPPAQPATPAPAPQPQAATPPPAEAPQPAPPEAPKPNAAARKPAAPANSTSVAEPTGPVKAKPPEADIIKPWWPDPAKLPAQQLKLQYAGQVQGEQAIALLFSDPVNLDSVRQHVQILTLSGNNVAGTWELGKNPRLAVFRGARPGRYTVILGPEVADQQGLMLGMKLQGPAYIQE